MAKQPVSGSDKVHPEGATCVGACNPAEEIEVVVMLRRQDESGFRQLMAKIDAGEAPRPSRAMSSKSASARRKRMSRKSKRFAAQYGLTVVRADPGSRSVVLKGTIEQFQKAFDVKLERFEHHNIGEYRGRTGPVNVPDDMHDAVTAVLGLDSRPQARPHFRFRPPFKPARGLRAGVVHAGRSRAPLRLSRKATARASASASSNSAAAIARATSARISRSSA